MSEQRITFKPYVVQNADRVVTARDFKDYNPNQLLVRSFFPTIQGEGPWAGRPTFFLRLGGCNYGDKQNFCNWCDTSFDFDRSKVMTFDEIYAEYKKCNLPHGTPFVITGGEPLLQKNTVNLVEWLDGMYNFDSQIETNGSQIAMLHRLQDTNTDVVVVISPKASAKGYVREAPIGPDDDSYRSNIHYKFVLTANPDDPHHVIPDWALDKHLQVWVSPMAVYSRSYEGEVSSIWEDGLIDREQTAANYKYAGEYAMKNGLRVSIQQHLMLAMA